MLTVGDTLTDLFNEARSELVLVAPFMKAAVIAKIVNAIAVGVQISCITRWRPHEIKAGVNDLEIWDVIQSRENAKLLLIPTLHAKYYRSDNRCAIGSANLTSLGLGWAPNPNVELLITSDVDARLQVWESCLLSQGIEVDNDLVRHLRQLVEALPMPENAFFELRLDGEESAALDSEASSPTTHSWLPMLRYPAMLYDVYSARTENISKGAKETALHDLMALSIPRGLDKQRFEAEVAAVILQMPLVRKVDNYLSQSRRFGAVSGFIKSLEGFPEDSDASAVWQTLMRWFLYFLPTRYRRTVPHHSEVIQRIE